MVSKHCLACDGYYTGELDGEYLCPECRRRGAAPRRPLSGLDGGVQESGVQALNDGEWQAAGPRPPAAARPNAKAHAA